MRRPPPTIPPAIVTRPVTFDLGEHKLVVTRLLEGRWTVAVDSRLLDASFHTQADAWQAGVREAHRIDQPLGK
jgi:hypothetical protein